MKHINMHHINSAAKWGALVGAGLYLGVGIILTVLGLALFSRSGADPTTNPGEVALGCFEFFALLFAYSAAGFYAGRETRRPGMGALAGMAAFVVYAILGALYEPGSGGGQAAAGGFGARAAAALVSLGIAALMGWLGGRPGAQRALKRPASTAPSTTPAGNGTAS